VRSFGIVVAGGTGARFGRPKQFELLAGTRLVDHAVLAASRWCDAIVLVLPAGVAWDGPAVHAVVEGGCTRSASVRAGLAAVPDDVEVVVVHDAARPLAGDAVFRAVVAAVEDADGAVPGVPVGDTVKQVEGSRVVATLPRDELVAVQTPQAFRAEALRAAHASGAEGTDDAALVEAIGGTVVVVPGDPVNFKVTAPDDLRRAVQVLEARG
jgi:2-C-methyl-D-erythritol 4-phosphate cytidylyltransferase